MTDAETRDRDDREVPATTDTASNGDPRMSVAARKGRLESLEESIAGVRSALRILGGVTAAMQPPRLLVGLMLAAALMAAGGVWDAFSPETIPPGGLTIRGVSPEVIAGARADGSMHAPFGASVAAAVHYTQQVAIGTLRLDPPGVANAFVGLFLGIPIGLWRHDPLFLFGYGLIFVAATGLFGGALARMAACDLAGSQRVQADDALAFAARCWRSMALAPLAPLLIAGLLWALIVLLGLPLRWPIVDLLGAILFGLAIVLGALVAISLLGYAAAFPLLIPAVACERCDAGEAQQRAFAYLLQRPARLFISMVLGIAGFAVGYLVVAGIAAATLQVTTWAVTVGAPELATRLPDGYGPFRLTPTAEAEASGMTAAAAAGLVGFWRTLVVGLVAAWVFAYYYTASTTIYLALRESTDGQEPSEIWQPGMIHGTFVAAPDPAVDRARRETIRRLDERWRATLRWLAQRRAGTRR